MANQESPSMKLYYAPGACSLASHILALEAGLPLELAKVDLKARKVEDGADYLAVNSKGYVPTLQLDGGESLTESAVVLQFLADQAPGKNLAPAFGTLARYRLQEWLNFIGSELHKGRPAVEPGRVGRGQGWRPRPIGQAPRLA
jgi:glutathione S-transferase